MSPPLQWRLLLRCYRAAVLCVAVVLIHQQSRWFELQRPAPFSLKQARKFFPSANRIQLRDAERGLHFVTDARGDTIGCLLTTSPQTDAIIGYAGPNNLLIALDARGAIAGLELLQSGDTQEHVEKVRRDPVFLRSFIGWKPNEMPPLGVDGVSGATLTSLAIAEGIQGRLGGAAPSLRFPDPPTLDEARGLFANAARIVVDRQRLRVEEASGRLLGYAVRSSPQADNVAGYRGPTDCLIALAPDGRTITGVRIRRSYDTDSYVEQIRRAESFWKLFVGRTIDELSGFEFTRGEIEGISGATQTARAVAEGLKRRSAAELTSRAGMEGWRPKVRDWVLSGVIGVALIMSFTSLRGHAGVRVVWQLFLVGYVGLASHDLLSLALLGGWATNGPPLKAASGLALLGVAALLVPWSTRRQLYCHQVCPHGAAQQLLGKILRRRWALPPKLAHPLEMVPTTLLLFSLVALLLGWRVNLAALEPFDAWAWRTAGAASIAMAIVGLAASLFIPQAYCRFGCPTGALLNFVRASGSADRWARRDWAALACLAAGVVAFAGVRVWPRAETTLEVLTLTGRTMGTTWSARIRDEVADAAAIEKAIAGEFEWAESLTSHWRTNTDLSEFNRTPGTNAMPVPWPVLTLSRWSAEISRATDGAFDITVSPLVKLWGFGPGPRRPDPPAESEISRVLPAVGWQKLEVEEGLLRKTHPALEVDLSGIAKGWAIDQVAELLQRRGYTNFLVEAGGELRAHGRWKIAIEHPARSCVLLNESIATSGTYRQNRESGASRYSHLIDPRTGRPVTHRTVSVSVRGADCAHADAWATALNVMGVEAGMPLAERLGIAAQFVTEQDDGRLEVRQSARWTASEAPATPPSSTPH